MKMVEQV
jgi:hypothetical protein